MNKSRQKFARQERRRIFLLAGLMVIGGGILGLTMLRVQPVFKNDKVTTAETGQGKTPSLKRETAEFVDEMRQRDAELLEKWRRLKERNGRPNCLVMPVSGMNNGWPNWNRIWKNSKSPPIGKTRSAGGFSSRSRK